MPGAVLGAREATRVETDNGSCPYGASCPGREEEMNKMHTRNHTDGYPIALRRLEVGAGFCESR